MPATRKRTKTAAPRYTYSTRMLSSGRTECVLYCGDDQSGRVLGWSSSVQAAETWMTLANGLPLDAGHVEEMEMMEEADRRTEGRITRY